MKLSFLITVLKEAASEWSEDNAMRLSAALAYYTLLSLTPLIVVIIAIAGLVYGEQAASERVAQQIRSFAGTQAGDAMLSLALSAHSTKSKAAIIGTVILLLGASGVFGELKSAMNAIWGVVARPGRSYFAIVSERLISLGIVLLSGFIVIVAVTASAVLAALESTVNLIYALPHFALQIADYVITFGITSGLFILIFRFLPDVRLRWADIWMSGVGTAFLFTIGKSVIGLYLGTSGIASSFGAAGSVIIVELWVYYSAGILFFGVETAKIITLRRRGEIVPRRNAIRLEERLRTKFENPPKY